MNPPLSEVLGFEALARLLSYDATSGRLTWLPRQNAPQFNARFAGRPAGSISEDGYVKITLKVDDHVYYPLGHRIAASLYIGRWLTEDEEVDHRNNRRADNAWDNLRLCDHAGNGKNQTLFSTNTSGFKGVYFNKPRKKWLAQILIAGKRKSIGYFDDPADGARAYDEMTTRHFGEFAKTNQMLGLIQ